jgi:hypothetical protein
MDGVKKISGFEKTDFPTLRHFPKKHSPMPDCFVKNADVAYHQTAFT